jgi:hypothetical protein
MIPFLALFFSSLNIELKNEILYHILVIILNQICMTNYAPLEYAIEMIGYDEISCGWEIILN